MGLLRHRLAGLAGPLALAFVLVTLALQLLPGLAPYWQFARPAFVQGAWWQLLTAQWVHLNLLHAAVNALGLIVLVAGFQGLVAGRLQLLALLGGYAGVALVLVLDADCTLYAGASGALHGLLAGCACALLLVPPPGPTALTRQRLHLLGGGVLLGLAAKLLVQHFAAPNGTVGWLGLPTYYPAHEAGALGGMLLVLALARRLVAPVWSAAAAVGPERRRSRRSAGPDQRR